MTKDQIKLKEILRIPYFKPTHFDTKEDSRYSSCLIENTNVSIKIKDIDTAFLKKLIKPLGVDQIEDCDYIHRFGKSCFFLEYPEERTKHFRDIFYRKIDSKEYDKKDLAEFIAFIRNEKL